MKISLFIRAFSTMGATAVLVFLGACGPAGKSTDALTTRSAVSQVRAGTPHLGLVGFDGSTSTPAKNTTIYQFVQASPIADKRYFAGTDMLATDFDRIVDEATRYVCSVHDARPFDALGLIGYSRGGGAALRLAVRLKTACRTPVPVRWLGLLDANVTSVEQALIEGNAGRDFLSTRCFHVTKKSDPRPFLGTAGVLSCDRRTVDGDHNTVAQNPLSLSFLGADAASVMPGLVGIAQPSLDASTKACRVNNTPRDCLSAGCSWTNARCEPM